MNITAKRLKQLREERKLSQNDVAKLIGISRTAYVKYESGENRPIRKLNELSKLFNVSTDYLLGNDQKYSDTTKDLVLSDKEREIIYKYRFLSSAAKGTVELILENQYENEKEKRSNEEKAI